MKYARHLAIGLTLLLAACDGGDGSSPAVPGTQAITGKSTSPSSVEQTAKLTLSWHLAATKASVKARKPQYVSPSSAQLVTDVVSVNGSAPPSWVAANNPSTSALSTSTDCSITSSVETCAVTVPAPPGTVVYTFTVEDSSNKVLSETPSSGVSETVAQGASNLFAPVNLEAVIASVDIDDGGGPAPSLINGDLEAVTYNVTPYDADGNVVAAKASSAITYANPFTIGDPDPTGATELIPSSWACPPAGTTYATGSSVSFTGDSGSGDALVLCYSGFTTTSQFSLELTLNGKPTAFVTPANAAVVIGP